MNPGPFNIKGKLVLLVNKRLLTYPRLAEHTAIVIMASTASSVAIAMEVIAAIGEFSLMLRSLATALMAATTDLFYNEKLNAAVAIFQIFSSLWTSWKRREGDRAEDMVSCAC